MVRPTDEEIQTHQGSETWYKRVPWVGLYKLEHTGKVRQLDVGKCVSQQNDQQKYNSIYNTIAVQMYRVKK